MGAVEPCCLSSASEGRGACMGLKIFCLNLSHCLDFVSVPLCVSVCMCGVCVCVHKCVCHRRVYKCWYLCVWTGTCQYQWDSSSCRYQWDSVVQHKRQYCFKPSFLVSSFWYYFILYCSNTQDFSTICGHKERKNGYQWHLVIYRIILRKEMNIYLHVPEYLALKTKTIQTKGIIVAHVEVRSVANSVQ